MLFTIKGDKYKYGYRKSDFTKKEICKWQC